MKHSYWSVLFELHATQKQYQILVKFIPHFYKEVKHVEIKVVHQRRSRIVKVRDINETTSCDEKTEDELSKVARSHMRS